MPKRSRAVLLDIVVDRAGAMPLQRQVYLGIRRLILAGRLKPGAHLPSTRFLANELRLGYALLEARIHALVGPRRGLG